MFTAETHRAKGKECFQAQCYEEAAMCYREALQFITDCTLPEAAELGQAVRLNIVVCLQKLGSPPDEALSLCDEVLQANPASAKALFWRGIAWRDLARRPTAAETQKELLGNARRDFLQAARIAPTDRQVRSQLDEVTEQLKSLPGEGDSLRLAFGGGMYDDRDRPPVEPEPPEVCSVCGRLGHARCGRDYWVEQRARWLQMPEQEVAREPTSFEEDGSLRVAILAVRAKAADLASKAGGASASTGGHPRESFRDADGVLLELSDEERDMLEDCIESIERPYPKLKRPLSLPQAVTCAEEFWAED